MGASSVTDKGEAGGPGAYRMVGCNFTDELWADQPGLRLKADCMGPRLRQGGTPEVSGCLERKEHQTGHSTDEQERDMGTGNKRPTAGLEEARWVSSDS